MFSQKIAVAVIAGFLLTGCSHHNSVAPKYTADPMSALVHFYRGPLNHLAAVRRGTCPMYPSSSSYSLECIKKHGPIIGWVMTCDRLVRSGRDELHLSPWITINGRQFNYDPVEANDFWWFSSENEKSPETNF